jgi:Flp pilus assembly pilin Flp
MMDRFNAWATVQVGRLAENLRREDGQGATEYAMVIGFLVVALALTLGVLGASITGFLGRVAAKLGTLNP